MSAQREGFVLNLSAACRQAKTPARTVNLEHARAPEPVRPDTAARSHRKRFKKRQARQQAGDDSEAQVNHGADEVGLKRKHARMN